MHFRQAGVSLSAGIISCAGAVLFALPTVASPPNGLMPARPRTAPATAPAPPAAIPVSPAAPKPVRAPVRRVAPEDATGETVRKPQPSRTAPAGASGKDVPQYADAWSSEMRPTASDLQLKPEDARKAEALANFSQGVLAEDNSDQESALAGYRRALELDPRYSELAVKVAFELVRKNNVSEAIQILKDSVKAAPKDPLPMIYLSQIYADNLKKPDLGLKFAEQALEAGPDNFKSYLALYELLTTTGNAKKADETIDRASKHPTKEPQFWTDLGEFYQKLYIKEDGSSSPEELQRMNAVYQKLAVLGEGNAAILGKVGDYYVLSKQVEAAIPFYRTVLSLPPRRDDPPLTNIREKLARCLVVTKQSDEAINVLEQIVKESPLRFDTYEMLGELYWAKGDLPHAMENYRHSLLLDATDSRNHIRLAELLRQAKQYDQAIELLQQARKRFPDLPYITYGLALAYTQAKRNDEALVAFAEAETIAQSHNEEILDARFYFNYGATAEQAAKFDRATELLKQSIQLDPSWPQAYNYLGYMWADRGERLEEAITMIKKAVELDPENGAYLDSLGWAYFQKGDFPAALKELVRARENILREDKKDDPTVLDHLADAYVKTGKPAEALTLWQKAVTLDSDDPKVTAKIAEKLESAKQKLTSGAPAAVPKPPE